MQYYLAVDIGASSGRHILAHFDQGKMVLEEVYRFENKMEKTDGHLCWHLPRIFSEILAGMKQCARIGKKPASIGIDTWGVDFVLLDEKAQILGQTVAYRDARSIGMDREVAKLIPDRELYAHTGIQKQMLNSIYHLMAIKKRQPELLNQASRFLMIPEYLNFLLSGKMVSEYTNATTTGLANAKKKTWDEEIIARLGLRPEIFAPLHMPCTLVGRLSDAIQKEVGFDCDVVLAATHDTASAVLSVPTRSDDAIFLSSGTWSLMGVERMHPDCSEASMKLNFTNEGGYAYRFRYLKNIMGLWIIQSIRRELGQNYSFAQLCEMAEEAADFPTLIDVDDPSFLAPEDMQKAIRDYCERSGQRLPDDVGSMVKCVLKSLAQSYAKTVRGIEQITGRQYSALHIVGGGCQNTYLNRLSADATGKRVFAGPVEATAIGNVMIQAIRAGELAGLEDARAVVRNSFPVTLYEPHN